METVSCIRRLIGRINHISPTNQKSPEDTETFHLHLPGGSKQAQFQANKRAFICDKQVVILKTSFKN